MRSNLRPSAIYADELRQLQKAPPRMNASDERLLALYPRWRALMAEWDTTSDRLEETDCAGHAVHRQIACVW